MKFIQNPSRFYLHTYLDNLLIVLVQFLLGFLYWHLTHQEAQYYLRGQRTDRVGCRKISLHPEIIYQYEKHIIIPGNITLSDVSSSTKFRN
jgi:hypothetical protein